MKFPFFIAWRYLISKRRNNVINIITRISIAGVGIGTMALVIVLSVFNGFETLIISMFNSFNPDLQVTSVSGKTFHVNEIPINEIKNTEGVFYVTEVIEENALIRYNKKQAVVNMKGVNTNYQEYSGLDTMMISGDFVFEKRHNRFAIMGAGIAYTLDINIHDQTTPLAFYVPKRGKINPQQPMSAFNYDYILPGGFFSVQQEFDNKYILVPLEFARKLLEYDDQITSLELSISPDADGKKIQESLQEMLGNDFSVKNRFQQQEVLYKILKSEKWFTFLILTFILIIAAFNVIGSLSMLIIDKKHDIAVIWSMGSTLKQIKNVFLIEGTLITLLGSITGLVLGSVICFLQQHFGLIKIQGNAAFIIEAYPVQMKITDFVLILFTVAAIGVLASYYPIRQISSKHIKLLQK